MNYFLIVVGCWYTGSLRMPQPARVETMMANNMALVRNFIIAHFPFGNFSQRLAARRTLTGAVPPKLVLDATEASTVKTLKTALVMPEWIACSSSSESSDKLQDFFSASATMRPVT